MRKCALVGAALAAMCAVTAQTCNWTGAENGFWTNANNWAEGRVPGQYYLPDGTLTGGWLDEAVFGDGLTGKAVTTISFDGVYSISNLYTQGSTTRYTYGANADEFIPIQCWGSFVGSRYADSHVPTIACKLRLGVECTDAAYGSETPTIQTENPNEPLVIGPWGYRTKRPDITTYPKEPGLNLVGKGILQFDGAYNTGWGNFPQTTVTMSGGKMIVNVPLSFRTLNLKRYASSTEPTTIYIGENGSISPASSYNCLSVQTNVRVYGPGTLKVLASYQTTRNDGYNNYPGWFFSGFDVNSGCVFTLESPISFGVWNGYATAAQLEEMKVRMVLGNPGTFVKRGYGELEGEVMACCKSWDRTNLRYVAAATGTFDVDAMGTSDNSVTGSLGCVDFLLGDDAVLRHSGPGEMTDRSIILTGIVENATGKIASRATFEFDGTGTMTLASPVYCRGVETGTLKLANSTANAAVADCAAGAGVEIVFVKGPWRFGENFTSEGNIRLSGTAELTLDRSMTVTNLCVDSGSSTVFVEPGVTLAVTNFTCAAGATIDFEVLGTTARVVVQNSTVSGTVKVNGVEAKFNADGSLDYADNIADHVWKWAGDGSWTAADRWLNGVPTESSFNSIIVPGADYTVKVDRDELMNAHIGDEGRISLTNLTIHNFSGGTTTLLVTNGAEMTFVSRTSNDASAPLHLERGSRLSIVDAKVILRDHGNATGGASFVSPLQNKGGSIEVGGTGELVCVGREGTAVGAKGNQDGYYVFGTGHYVFRDNAKLHFISMAPAGCGWSSVLYPQFKPSASGDLKMEFLDNSCYLQESNLSYWRGEVGANGRHAELVFDTAYPNEQTFWQYSFIGCADGLGEMKFKRGKYAFGTYITMIGGIGTSDNAASASVMFATGRVEIASGVTLRPTGYNEKRTMTVGHALSSTLSRGQALAYGEIVTAGAYTQNRGSFYVGAGACGEGVVRQTGGSFKPMYNADSDNNPGAVAIGLFGGKGLYEIDDGVFQTYRNVYVGGATANDLSWTTAHKNMAKLETCHDAQGELVVKGGTFQSEKSIILGADGTGSLTLSGTGMVTAASIVVSNTVGQAASCVKFISDAQGRFGTIAPSTKLVFADGSKIVIDATALPEGKSRATMFALDGDIEGLDYIREHVELVNAPKGAVLVWSADGRSLGFHVPRGMLISFR